MSIRSIAFSLCASILWLSGCDTVTLDGPIGTPLTKNELTELEGRWLNEDSDVSEIRLSDDGVLIAGTLEFDEEGGKFKVNSTPLPFRRSGEVLFMYLTHKENGKEHFLLLRVVRDGEEMTLQQLDADKVKAAVENGILDGEVKWTTDKKHFNVMLRSESEKTQKVLTDPNTDSLFDDDAIVKLKRIKKFD